MNTIVAGLWASTLAGLCTGVGAIPILFTRQLSPRIQGILLGFGGGVMLAATSFSLIIPGIESAVRQGYSDTGAALAIAAGLMLGGVFLWYAHNNFPHEHIFKGREGPSLANFERIWLFIIAITLHNFPEGLAVGVGFGADDPSTGYALAMGIGLQNIPEGLVVAIGLRSLDYSVAYSFGVSVLTGLVEPVGGLLGVTVVSIAQPLLPWGMAFAAGAMLFVIADEIIPETQEKGIAQEGTLGVMVGFAVMMVLDIALG
ncbi:MAG: ZIP family metal transporter [Elainellaceae cyanobacterium]